MKILLIFADMLRPNLLHTWNESNAYSEVDWMLERWNGTAFINCYTPAPDTPRSLACMWSGLYPKHNGCDTRIKYPRFYLSNANKSFLQTLKRMGYSFNFIMSDQAKQLGELPDGFYSNEMYFSGEKQYEDALREIEIKNNSVTYIGFHDYHIVVDDWFAEPCAGDEGNRIIGSALKMIDDILDIDQFDLMFIYSDHGWKMSCEPFDTLLSRLGDSRTQVFMYVRKRGDNKVLINNKLCTIMDIGPTICDYIGKSLYYVSDGISLFDKNEYDKVLIEDHLTFDVNFGLTIEAWGIRTRNNLICYNTKLDVESLERILDSDNEDYIRFIEENGSCFKENIKTQKIIDAHSRLKEIPTYYDGKKRKKYYPPEQRYFFRNINKLKNKKCIIYGMGRVGRDYLKQFVDSDEMNCLSIYDRNWKRINAEQLCMKVQNPQDIVKNASFDYVIVAVENRELANLIRTDLLNYGVDEKKILWDLPEKIPAMKREV